MGIMRQVFSKNINFNVAWCDLGRQADLTSFTSCTVKSYCGLQQALLEKMHFTGGIQVGRGAEWAKSAMRCDFTTLEIKIKLS